MTAIRAGMADKRAARLAALEAEAVGPDPQAADGRVLLPFLLAKAADPAGPLVVVPVTAEGVMHLVDEAQGKIPETFLSRLPEKFEVVADREGIRPEVSNGPCHNRVEPGQAGKVQHDIHGRGGARIHRVHSPAG